MVKSKETPAQSSLFNERAALTGNSVSGIEPTGLDGRLLYWVVCLLATRRASIQIGVTKDGGSYAIQYWDGAVPIKEYFRNEEEVNSAWAALLRAAYKRSMSEEMEEVVRQYGW